MTDLRCLLYPALTGKTRGGPEMETQEDRWAAMKPKGWVRVATLTIPTQFWSDHSVRHQDREWDGPSGWPVKYGSRMTTVEFNDEELACLRDDCSNYVEYARTGNYEGDKRLTALAKSAARTLAIIEAIDPA